MSFCRVAEFQRRGVVNLHAVIRADGVDGEPLSLTAEHLARAALTAGRAVTVAHPLGVARWGSQVDVQILDRSAGPQAQQVAGYVAKYATKSSDGGGALDAPIGPKRSWPAGRSRRTCAGWPRPRGRSVPTRRLSRSAAAPCPRARLRRPFPIQVPPLPHQLQRPQGRPGRLARSMRRVSDGDEATDRSLKRRLRATGVGWANQGEAHGRPSSSGNDSRSGGSATRSGTAGRSRIWSDGERGETAMKRRQFGSVRRLPSGRWQASYWMSVVGTSPK